MQSFLNRLPRKGRARTVLSLLCLLLTTTAYATDYYVAPAPTGAPGNPGTEASPKTLAAAAKIAVAGDRVLLKAGIYRETAEIQKDGATFMPAPGVSASDVIINGTDLMQTWTVASGSTYSTPMSWNLDTEINNKMDAANLAAFTNGIRIGTNQVFQDGRMMELLRWPKRPVALLDTAMTLMKYNAEADNMVTPGTAANTSYDKVTITDDDLLNLPNPDRWVGAKIWINLSQKNSGLDGQGKTGTVTSISGNTMVVNMPGHGVRSTGGAWGVGPGSEYFLFDPTATAVGTDATVINQMLAAGEWWRNSENGTLYVKTRDGSQPGNSETASNKVEVKRRHFGFWPDVNSNLNRHSYTIQDLTLFACAITTDRKFNTNAVNEGARDITLQRLTFKYPSHFIDFGGNYVGQHSGWTGVVLSGRRNTIQDCDFSFSAGTALSVVGADHKVLRNTIHDTNYLISEAGALNTGGLCMDTEIGHNKIWNTTHRGIGLTGGVNSDAANRHKFRVHHNTIYDFMMRSYDSGAIDGAVRDFHWARFDHNLIYNTRPEARIGGRKYGIYFDYGSQATGPGFNRMRVTIDHNVVYDVNNAATINAGWDVHVFNNVFLTVDTPPPGANPENSVGLSLGVHVGDGKVGTNVLAFNNILSEPPPKHYENKLGTLLLNNITNAKGEEVLNELFVDATNPNRAARNYQLKSTATRAIDKGINVDEFTSNYDLDKPVVGVTDIGAYEWGSLRTSADTEKPSKPISTAFVVADLTGNGFTLSWDAATDNVGVAYYEVYSNGALYKKTNQTSLTLKELEGSTTYFMQVVAVDGSGNRSDISDKKEVKTSAPVANVEIAKTATPPTIDGTKEATWVSAMLPIAKVAGGTAAENIADFSGEWTSLWDDTHLYIFIDVVDNVNKADATGFNFWEDDHIEIMIDPKGTRLDEKPLQYFMVRGKEFYKFEWPSGVSVSGADTKLVEKTDGSGYRVELKIPFTALGITPKVLDIMGIDVQIGDDDDGGGEDTRLSWHTTSDKASATASVLGLAKFTSSENIDDLEKPTAPTEVKANAISHNSFRIDWTASTDNYGIANYEVFVDGNLVGTPKETSFTVNNLKEATTYTVQVRAKDRVNSLLSDFSSKIMATTPNKASAVIYESEDASFYSDAAVETKIAGYSGRGYVTGITIHKSGDKFITYTLRDIPSAGSYAAFLRYTEGGTLSLHVNGTRIGNVVFPTSVYQRWDEEYGVMSLDLQKGDNTVTLRIDGGMNNKNGPIQDYLAVYLPGADSQAPTAPTDVTVSNTTATGFTLNWTASTDNVGVVSYEVYKDGSLVGTTTSTTYNVTSLSPGTYAITVKAVDAAGSQSDASAAIEIDIVGGSVSAGNNPGFENNFTSWSTYGTASVNTTAANVRSGAKSGYFANGGGNYTITGLTANTTYKVRAWVKAVIGTNIWVVVSGFGGSGNNPGQQMTSTSWTQTGDIVFTTGANSTQATLAAWTGSGSSAYFDDYTIELNSSGIPVRTVSVTPAAATVEVGGTQQLKATTSPVNATDKTVKWSSSNTAVATVHENTGVVTGVGVGIATITATSNDGSNKTATTEFTVDPTVTRGEVVQEIWTIWSDDKTVASIPVNTTPRTTRVLNSLEDPTANGTEGELDTYGQRIRGYIIPSATATYYFYVAADDNGYFYLSSDYQPANKGTDPIAQVNGATGVREWQNSSQAATQKSAGKALLAGKKYYFEAYMRERFGGNNFAIGWTTAANNSGITVIGSENLGRYDENCTTCRSSAEIASKLKTEVLTLKVHPNPASSEVTISLDGFEEESAVQVKMSDMSGKLFVGQQVPISEGVKQVTLPVNQLPQGLFFVTVQGSKTTKSAKLVITK